MLIIKAHNKGYTRKDGAYVSPFDDSRKPATDLFGGAIPKQSSLFGSSKKAKAYHPKTNDNGKPTPIYDPSKPSSLDAWDDPDDVATVVPGGDMPIGLNGTLFEPWAPPEDWEDVEGQNDDIDEPPVHLTKGKSLSSGVLIEEPDGRVWVVHPTNAFGGYKATFPKGRVESDLTIQANAIKECWEEAGIKVAITGYVGDFERTTTVTRFYRAVRMGGLPSDMGWESQAVSLVPKEKLGDVLNAKVDHDVVSAFLSMD